MGVTFVEIESVAVVEVVVVAVVAVEVVYLVPNAQVVVDQEAAGHSRLTVVVHPSSC